jgi:hypothetical protein
MVGQEMFSGENYCMKGSRLNWSDCKIQAKVIEIILTILDVKLVQSSGKGSI